MICIYKESNKAKQNQTTNTDNNLIMAYKTKILVKYRIITAILVFFGEFLSFIDSVSYNNIKPQKIDELNAVSGFIHYETGKRDHVLLINKNGETIVEINPFPAGTMSWDICNGHKVTIWYYKDSWNGNMLYQLKIDNQIVRSIDEVNKHISENKKVDKPFGFSFRIGFYFLIFFVFGCLARDEIKLKKQKEA